MYLLQKEGAFLTGHDLFLKRVGAAYHAFLEDVEVRNRPGMASATVWAQERHLLSSRFVTFRCTVDDNP